MKKNERDKLAIDLYKLYLKSKEDFDKFANNVKGEVAKEPK